MKTAHKKQRARPGTESRLESWPDAAPYIDQRNYQDTYRGGSGNPVDSSVKACMVRARNWEKESQFLSMFVGMKADFFNYGYRVTGSAKELKFAKWLEEEDEQGVTNAERINGFVRSVWEDFLLMNNAVVFWRAPGGKNGVPLPDSLTVMPPEKCEYSDAMGIQKLRVATTWQVKDFEGETNAAELIARYTVGTVELSAAKGEFFRVLKTGKAGYGFGWPRVYAVFRPMEQAQSLEVGDNLASWDARSVLRQIAIGHEIRTGPHAGKSTWFWTVKRSEEVRKKFENRVGKIDFTSNFDVEVKYPFMDPKRWDPSRYVSAERRMMIWGGPLAFMLLEDKPLNPFWLPMLLSEARAARERVKKFCESIITKVLQPPAPAVITWSEEVFMEPRIFLEMLKFGAQSGPVSQRSYLSAMRLDADQERKNKEEEGKLLKSNPNQVLPVFDPAHGKKPGMPDTAAGDGGRPSGVKN